MDVYAQVVKNNALAAGTPETVVQLVTPSTIRAQITKIKIAFDGTSSTAEPVDVVLVTQSTAGTSSAGTVGKIDPASPTALVTSLITFTAEPAADSNEIWADMIHPQGGTYEVNWSLGDRTAPLMPVSSRMGLKCTAGANVNTTVTINWCE